MLKKNKKKQKDFPGGSMVMNQPSTAWDASLIPGQGLRSNMPHGN